MGLAAKFDPARLFLVKLLGFAADPDLADAHGIIGAGLRRLVLRGGALGGLADTGFCFGKMAKGGQGNTPDRDKN